jgi:hypothetical protein
VVAAASQINKLINTKAVSIDQLNRFCDEATLPRPANLLRPELLTTGTEEEKLEAAKGAVMKQVRGIMEPQQIQKATAAAAAIFGSQNPFTRRPVGQSTVAPVFDQGRPEEVVAAASQINKLINTKAVSIDQLNRFCDEANLLRPELLTTGTEEEKLEAAKGAVVKQVRGIMEPQQIQKATAAAAAIFQSQNP